MKDLKIPRDAFSHGQIRSKLWLSENFANWSEKYLSLSQSYTLNWYGSWVGLGPFFLLKDTKVSFNQIKLFDLNEEHLETSRQILDYWHCESTEIQTLALDVNDIIPDKHSNQIFINTSCEHMINNAWLENIPKESFVLLQSTNMPHPEHTNCSNDFNHFITGYGACAEVLGSAQIHFQYPDKKFSRFMLFGIKK